MRNFRNAIYKILIIFVTAALITGCQTSLNWPTNNNETTAQTNIDKSQIPSFDGQTYNIVLNNNKTYFTEQEMNLENNYYSLSELDSLGRCGPAMAVVSKDTITTTERESIGDIKPSGWQTKRYDGIVSEKLGYIYNRSHLLMFKLCQGLLDTNVKENLITGTRFFNADEDYGMLKYETQALEYVQNSNNHLLYRVTPVFEGDNLVATGVIMEAKSKEDNGESFEFCVFIYNVQPNVVNPDKLGVTIDYATGETHKQTQEEYDALLNNDNKSLSPSSESSNNSQSGKDNTEATYVLNTNSKKIHKPDCSAVDDMSNSNKQETNESIETLLNEGYTKCKMCNPE